MPGDPTFFLISREVRLRWHFAGSDDVSRRVHAAFKKKLFDKVSGMCIFRIRRRRFPRLLELVVVPDTLSHTIGGAGENQLDRGRGRGILVRCRLRRPDACALPPRTQPGTSGRRDFPPSVRGSRWKGGMGRMKAMARISEHNNADRDGRS